MTNLLDLAAKVEAAEGPSFALDCEINKAVGSAAWPPRAYTSSIDAAMMLVPADALMRVEHLWYGSQRLAYAAVTRYDEDHLWMGNYGDGQASAATPALALTAASLRARSENPA